MRFAVATLFAVLLLASGFSPAWAAFGISPPFLGTSHLVPGADYSETIYLVQDKPDQDLGVVATLDISENIRSWVEVSPGMAFTIPQGVRQFPVQVRVRVPKDASLGVYSGTLNFVGGGAQTGQVTIALGVQLIMNLTVGDDIFRRFRIPYLKLMDIEEGWNPRVLLNLKNEGNVPENMTGATYELFDQYGSVRLAYIQKRERFPEVKPFSARELVVEFPVDLHLGQGEYWANAVFYQNDQVLASQKTVFQVLPPGSLAEPWPTIVRVFLGRHWMEIAGGFAALLVLLGGWKILRRRKRHS